MIVPDEFIVATDVLPLLHVPPEEASLAVVVLPMQTANVPVIGASAKIFTVTVLVTVKEKQLFDIV